MSSLHNDINPSSETKPNAKSASASFGFKRGFLNNNKTTRRATAAKAPSPPSTEDEHDECVICCYPLPILPSESCYYSCCGQVICNGCIIAQQRTCVVGTNVKKPAKGSKQEELEFQMMLGSKPMSVCPFCRQPEPTNDKDALKRLYKQIDKYKDPNAMNMLAFYYLEGERGLPKNVTKAEEFYQRSYALGKHEAACILAKLYFKEIPDKARMLKYLEEGVRRGNIDCMVGLAERAGKSGNCNEAVRLFMMAARSGHDYAMKTLMEFCYRRELLSKDDLATTLRAHKAANDAGKSEPREYAQRYKLKLKQAMEKKGNNKVKEGKSNGKGQI